MALPTYQEATKLPGHSDVLLLAESHFDHNSRLSCCLVNKQCKEAFNPLIWRDPVKILATQSNPFAAMNVFTQSAKANVSEETRRLVLTYDLRPFLTPDFLHKYAHDYQLYWDIARESWHRDWAWTFPNTRFIIIEGFMRFGSSSNRFWSGSEADPKEMWGRPPSASVRNAFDHIRPLIFSFHGSYLSNSLLSLRTPPLQASVMYLDLSYGIVNADWTRIIWLMTFPNLRVLKLRGLRLTDGQLPPFATSSNFGLWCLDIRDNLFTDPTLELLLNRLILPRIEPPAIGAGAYGDELYDDAPLYERMADVVENPAVDELARLRPDDCDTFMQHLLSRGDLEDPTLPALHYGDELIRDTGLTHLYLAGNKFTGPGIQQLLREGTRLQVLDVGSVKTEAGGMTVPHPFTSSYFQPYSTAHLLRSQGARMEKLRIHHSVVTRLATLVYQDDFITGWSLELLKRAEQASSISPGSSQKTLSPMDNHRLTWLTLTEIPTKSYGPILRQLIAFLHDCARQESTLKQARASLPSRHAPQVLSGLRVLRLEFMPESGYSPTSPSAGPSVSGDRDADEFHSQSAMDFSFFDEDDDGGGDTRTAMPSGSGWASTRSDDSRRRAARATSPRPFPERESPEPTTDVADALREFRKRTNGGWGGSLQLVLPHTS